MAVDTANKRFSLIGMARPETTMLPVPSGAFDTAAERQILNEQYALSAAAGGSPWFLYRQLAD